MAIILLRTIILFLALLGAMRLMGKRQLGELEISELIVTVLVSNIAAHPLQDIGIPLLNALLPILALLCCELILSGVMEKSVRARIIICGKPSILVANGVINQSEMRRNRFTLDELTEELRNQSILDISLIKYAILETSGKLNIILFPAERPVTAGQLSIPTDDPDYPLMVINNGRIIGDNLKQCGKDKAWLERQLRSHGVKSAREVYLMTVNSLDQIYFTPVEGKK